MNLPQILPLILAAIAAITGNQFELQANETMALAVLLGGLYQALSRWVLNKEAIKLGVPDPRAFWGQVTNWMSLGNALVGLVVIFTGNEVGLPDWFLPVVQLLAFAAGQQRLTAAQSRLTDTEALIKVGAVGSWRLRTLPEDEL